MISKRLGVFLGLCQVTPIPSTAPVITEAAPSITKSTTMNKEKNTMKTKTEPESGVSGALAGTEKALGLSTEEAHDLWWLLRESMIRGFRGHGGKIRIPHPGSEPRSYIEAEYPEDPIVPGEPG